MQLPDSILKDVGQIDGVNSELFCRAHDSGSGTSVRLHPLKGNDVVFEGSGVPWCKGGFNLAARPVFTTDPFFHGGAYYVQESSSMFLEYAFNQVRSDKKGIRVLDLCAAPGGKSTLLAALLSPEDLLVSNEVIKTRAGILEENVVRWGYSNNWVTNNDPADFATLEGFFDVIVVDAPCSGSGLFRKDERALKEWSEENVQLCAARQKRILSDIYPALAKDGILIYSTCSFSEIEDEGVADWLCTDLGFEGVALNPPAEWNIVTTISKANKAPGYRFFPHLVQGEGFYLAAFRKVEEQSLYKQPKFKTAKLDDIKKASMHLLAKDVQSTLINPVKDMYCAIYPSHEADFYLLSKSLYFKKAGLNIGQPTQKEWLPAHEVALSVDRNKTLAAIELDRENALRFLKKEEFEFDSSLRGWQLITYRGLGLGWVKALGNRVNNYLPKHWRIRMEIDFDADLT